MFLLIPRAAGFAKNIIQSYQTTVLIWFVFTTV